MTILSIDPSLANTAFVVSKVSPSGELLPIASIISSTKKREKVPVMLDRINRCEQHLNNLHAAVNVYSPTHIAVELPSGSQSSAASVGIGTVLMFIAAAKRLGEVITVSPTQVKKQVNGTNSAEKQEVIDYVDKKYPNFLPKKSNEDIHKGQAEHIADAVVIAEVAVKNSQKGIKRIIT